MSKSISIIIPTFNERDNITPLVKRIDRALSDYEIVFVDDDSSDGTAELAMGLSPTYPVTVIVRKGKKGLASAVVDGLEHVEGEIIGVMDADLQHPPEVLPELLGEIKGGADIAIASRYVSDGGCRDWGLGRRIVSRGATLLAHLLLPSTRQVKDPMSGFFMFRRRIISTRLKPVGYKILLEILVEGQFQKAAEVPYTFETRSGGQSKLNARQQVEYLRHIYSLMRRKGEVRRFVKFCAVGLTGVGVNLGLYWILNRQFGVYNQFAYAISVEASIISNFALNDFWTFADHRIGQGQSFLRRLGKFNLVSLGGWALNQGIFTLFNRALGLYDLLAGIIGIAVAILWNYILNRLWTWR